ncbi:MAG: hypothetical protein ACLGXA_21130 [Acidobacteriota bacterium]
MKKTLISILFALGVLLGISAPARAQSQYGLYQNCQLQTATGQAVAGAQVYFLDQPANTTNLTPQAQVYSSSTGGAVSQPLTTNGFGQCNAYLAPGLYTVVYISPYTGTRAFPDQAVYLPSGASTLINLITQILWPIASGTSLPSSLCPTPVTGNLTNGSPTILGVSNFDNIYVNQQVAGTGIPSGTYVQSIDSSAGSITLTQNATTTQSGVALSFYSVGQPFQNTSTNAEYFCGLGGWQSGVQQIVAGSNVTISPTSGTGVVTINAAGGSPAAPSASLQFNNAGAFGAANGDWSDANPGSFTLGNVTVASPTTFSCDGTNCTVNAPNVFTVGETIQLLPNGNPGDCLTFSSGTPQIRQSTILAATSGSYTIAESDTFGCSDVVPPGPALSLAATDFAGLTVNAGGYGISLVTVGQGIVPIGSVRQDTPVVEGDPGITLCATAPTPACYAGDAPPQNIYLEADSEVEANTALFTVQGVNGIPGVTINLGDSNSVFSVQTGFGSTISDNSANGISIDEAGTGSLSLGANVINLDTPALYAPSLTLPASGFGCLHIAASTGQITQTGSDCATGGITGTSLTPGTVYYQGAGGLTAAEADASATTPAVCVAVSSTLCAYDGVYQYASSPSWTVGGVLYLSDASAGALTQTAPTASGHYVQRVGVAIAADTVLIMPSLDVGGIQ